MVLFPFKLKATLKLLPIGNPRHMLVVDVLKVVDELGRVAVANGQANNGCETKSVATISLSISIAPLITPSHGRHASASLSTSTTPIIRGCGWCATTPQVVTSLEIPVPISHASPLPEVPPPTPPSQSSFDISIEFNLASPMHPVTPSYPPTSSNAPTLPIDPPHTKPMTMIPTLGLCTKLHDPPTRDITHTTTPTLSSANPLGPLVGIDTQHPDIDILDEHPPHQPSPPRGRTQCARKAPTFRTGGHKIGHKGSSMV